LQELCGHTHFLLCSVCSQPGCADIPYDAIDEHPALLVGRLGTQVGFCSLGMELKPSKIGMPMFTPAAPYQSGVKYVLDPTG